MLTVEDAWAIPAALTMILQETGAILIDTLGDDVPLLFYRRHAAGVARAGTLADRQFHLSTRGCRVRIAAPCPVDAWACALAISSPVAAGAARGRRTWRARTRVSQCAGHTVPLRYQRVARSGCPPWADSVVYLWFGILPDIATVTPLTLGRGAIDFEQAQTIASPPTKSAIRCR